MEEDLSNNVAAALAAGMELASPKGLIEKHLLGAILPPGAKFELKDISSYYPRPDRKRGSFQFEDARSFSEFVNREKTPETFILASKAHTSFTAVFNGNEAQSTSAAAQPGWGDYRASYLCPHSEEWKRWTAANGKKMSQADFALFIEDNALDIVQPKVHMTEVPDTSFPDSSQMLVVSSSLQAKNDVTFASALKLNNGEVQFKYEEQISGSTQNGVFEVPQRFAVAIPVFAGTDPWLIYAKLRYRIERGGLSMWFDFERLYKVEEKAFDEARAEITKATGAPIFLGQRQAG